MAFQGLTVSTDGQARLLLNGSRFRNIGVNWPGAVIPLHSQPSALACAYTTGADQDTGIAFLYGLGVRVVRVLAFPFWPAQWTYGVLNGKAWNVANSADREAHYLKLDAFVAKCRAAGMGVIWDMFWRIQSPSDLTGDLPRAGWLGSSNTRTFVTTITNELVTRYATEQAVYGWEFTNEANNYLNKSNYSTSSDANVTYGTLATYPRATSCFTTSADVSGQSDLADMLTWWGGVVRANDSQRIILSGNGACRYSKSGFVGGITNPFHDWLVEQENDNAGLNTASMHYYAGIGYCDYKAADGLSSLLTGAKHWARNNGRAFVLGEFGNQPRTCASITSNGDGTANVVIPSADGWLGRVGDRLQIVGTSTAWDATWTTTAYSADRLTATISAPSPPTNFTGTFYGSTMPDLLPRLMSEIIAADVDLAMLWSYDTDPLTPTLHSIHPGSGNEYQQAILHAANQQLGWA